MSDKPEKTTADGADEPPPFLGTWAKVYTFVICYLAALIALFYVFSRIVSS